MTSDTRSKATLAMLIASVVLLATSPARSAPGSPPDQTVLHVGDVATVFEPATGELASFADLYSWSLPDASGQSFWRVLLGFSQNEDVGTADVVTTVLQSEDGGSTFTLGPLPDGPEIRSLARLHDGTLLSVGFKPLSYDGAEATLPLYRSADSGQTWTTETTLLQGPDVFLGMRVHRGLLQLPDGTLLLPVYSRYAGDGGHSAELFESTDGGVNWSSRSVIAPYGTDHVYNETAIEHTVDGGLLAVMRTSTITNPGDLEQCRSFDEGLTWTAPLPVLVSIDGGPEGPRPGVDPKLHLLPNGTLLLSAGRLDNWIAVSADGLGQTWQQGQITYVNYPTIPAGASRRHGSSGYSGMATVGANRLLLVGDNCANSWGCPATESGWIVDGEYRIWKAFVDAITPDVGKIDLASKVAAGHITVDTNLTWADAAHPETRPAGAFDGDTSRWSAALRADGASEAYLSLALDRRYDLTRVGLCLHRGHAASAQVFVSEDGVSWGEAIVTTGPRVDHALRYHALDPPVAARFVKVVADPAPDCGPELPAGCSVLTELELYSTVDSFENDPVYAVPRGYTDATMAWTTLQDVDDSRRGLRLKDTSDAAQATLRRQTTASGNKLWEFRLHPVAMPNGFLFSLLGEAPGDDAASAFHLGVFADGSFGRYDWAAAQWSALSPPGRVAVGAWHTVRVVATTDTATLCLDGEEVASFGPSTAGITAINGHVFASAGTVPTGGNFVIDDVLFTDHSAGCADPPGPDAGMAPDAGVGADVGPTADASEATSSPNTGCGCGAGPGGDPLGGTAPWLLLLLALGLMARLRRI